jgi:hypothetical protein
MLANPLCTKTITESIELSTEDENFDLNQGLLDNVTISLYQNDNLNIRRGAIAEVINMVKRVLNAKGIGMEMINSIYVTASWRKPKTKEASNYIITYSYTISIPCPNESGQN